MKKPPYISEAEYAVLKEFHYKFWDILANNTLLSKSDLIHLWEEINLNNPKSFSQCIGCYIRDKISKNKDHHLSDVELCKKYCTLKFKDPCLHYNGKSLYDKYIFPKDNKSKEKAAQQIRDIEFKSYEELSKLFTVNEDQL